MTNLTSLVIFSDSLITLDETVLTREIGSHLQSLTLDVRINPNFSLPLSAFQPLENLESLNLLIDSAKVVDGLFSKHLNALETLKLDFNRI